MKRVLVIPFILWAVSVATAQVPTDRWVGFDGCSDYLAYYAWDGRVVFLSKNPKGRYTYEGAGRWEVEGTDYTLKVPVYGDGAEKGEDPPIGLRTASGRASGDRLQPLSGELIRANGKRSPREVADHTIQLVECPGELDNPFLMSGNISGWIRHDVDYVDEFEMPSAFDREFFDKDAERLETVMEMIKSKCNRNLRCAVEEMWRFMDVTGDRLLSLAELVRALKISVKAAMRDQLKPSEKAGTVVGLVALTPVMALTLMSNYDYNNDDLLSMDEALYEIDLADLAGVSTEEITNNAARFFESVQKNAKQFPGFE